MATGALSLVLALAAVAAEPETSAPRLVSAAPTRAGEEWSPRRLFNAGLRAEERGDLTLACQLYMAARLAPRLAFADELYARGAALRKLRLLAGRDDDAAAAAATLIGDSGDAGDLAPLLRTLLRRLDPGVREPLEVVNGQIISVRFHRPTGQVLVELEVDGGDRRVLEADGTVGPFSAGHRVAVVMRRIRGKAAVGWRLVAMGAEHADGWQILRVRGLPGPGMESGVEAVSQRR